MSFAPEFGDRMGRDLSIVAVSSPRDISRAALAFRDEVARLGTYRIVVTDSIATRKPMTDEHGAILAEAVFGFGPDERWWRRSLLAVTSPLAQAVRYESTPFWANADGIHTRHSNAQLAGIDLANFEERAFLRAAIVVPVHLSFGQLGMAAFGVAEGAPTDLAAQFEQHADALMMLTRRFVASYAIATRRRQWMPGDCNLTVREITCLRRAASGMTDQQIASSLGRSHATIRFHFRNAWAKLGAVSRSQAVFKAGQLGFLSLPN